MTQSSPQINIVIPLYNESLVFQSLIDRIKLLMANNKLSIEVILIDDGSSDNTADLMTKLSKEDKRFQSVILSRNFGHQIALTAGMNYINASEAVFIIDGDLQDPPELLNDFYAKIKEGYDVVYAVRKKRKEHFFKRTAYKMFYKILKTISYIDIPLDSGDFSLVSVKVINQLNNMPEESRFIRGMRSWVGFKQIGLEYERAEREEGESKYTFGKLLKLALNGIFNFSEFPIKAITSLGIVTIFISMSYLLYTLYMKLMYDNIPPGFTSIVFLIILFGGINLLAIGVIGEYILRIFFQVKSRPLFIVKQHIKDQTIQNG
jgi:polyisoprenyl-phosphate glycosyltransferase